MRYWFISSCKKKKELVLHFICIFFFFFLSPLQNAQPNTAADEQMKKVGLCYEADYVLSHCQTCHVGLYLMTLQHQLTCYSDEFQHSRIASKIISSCCCTETDHLELSVRILPSSTTSLLHPSLHNLRFCCVQLCGPYLACRAFLFFFPSYFHHLKTKML